MNQKEQLAAMIECLKQAKTFLSDGSPGNRHKTNLICFAINKVHSSDAGGWVIHGRVKQAIHIALQSHSTFCAWLNANNDYDTYAVLGEKKIQQLRHKWVNQIIRDWTKQLETM